jgi:hypothetical protein
VILLAHSSGAPEIQLVRIETAAKVDQFPVLYGTREEAADKSGLADV